MPVIYKDIFEDDMESEETLEVPFHGELNWLEESVDVSFEKKYYSPEQRELINAYLELNYTELSDELERLFIKTNY